MFQEKDPRTPGYNFGIEQHDRAIANSGIDVWLGAEPTFTLRSSEAPEWLSQALGGDKYAYALQIARELHLQHSGSIILRTVGRQYSGEERPRWSIGLYERRDGVPVWNGPLDPALASTEASHIQSVNSFAEILQNVFIERQWSCRRVFVEDMNDLRMLVRADAGNLDDIEDSDHRLCRPSVHVATTPESGLSDSLAEEGFYLFSMGERLFDSDHRSVWVELPAFKRPADFIRCLDALDTAAQKSCLSSLVIQGFPPPVDHTISWMTITPDPAVIEVNQAPEPTIRRFYAASREIFEVADRLGLSTYRMQYNGTVSDSGGGGQFTLGGRTPDTSPFFISPQLLPRLIRYFNQHPSLSYWFAPDYVGSASQLPRSDEGTREAFYELGVALEQLKRQTEVSPEFLWSSLCPFLTDPSGNSHRSELNIEKLWNPNLPGRGCLGLIECRAFRMPRTPERAAAIAMLLRSILGMLSIHDSAPALIDWGDELHDRFALPFFLRKDLRMVLQDLENSGFMFAPWAVEELLEDPSRPRWIVDFLGCRLTIEQAIEFWPLVGDVASQESGGSRLVDSSTLRLQISLTRIDPELPADLHDMQLQIDDFIIPLNNAEDASGVTRLIGLRYRDFAPWRGLHPTIKPLDTVILSLSHPNNDDAIEVSLHSWRTDGLPYDGLPENLDEAARRRHERLLVKTVKRSELKIPIDPPLEAMTPFTFDLRRL